jgi:hypothetical protein
MPMLDPPLQLASDEERPRPAEHKLLSRTVADRRAERVGFGEEDRLILERALHVVIETFEHP